jgi:putative ABC transport system permease protein
VSIGTLRLRLSARVVRDVDQAIGFASFAPRVLLNMSDLPATGLVQEGSRINYRLLLAGEAAQLAGLRAWLEKRLALGEKLEDVRDARPEIRTALERAERFFGLAALMAVVLAGVALALAARRFIMRHLDTCAMMRCLGASQAQVLRIFLVQFLLVGLAAVVLGCVLGYGVQAVLVRSIELMRESALPPPGWLPLVQAAASGMALLLGFTFLPLWQLKRAPALRVIRREIGMPEAPAALLYVSGAVVLGGLFLWQAGSPKLGLIVLAGLAGGVLVFGLLARLAIHLLRHLPFHKLVPFGLSLSKPGPGKPGQPVHPSIRSGRTDTEYRSGLAMQYAFASMARHGRANALQIVALSLGGMALLLLTLVRADLLENWRTRLPPDAPNRFVVNIQPDQRVALLDFFARQQLPAPKLYPMVRGRLVAVNQRAVSGDDYSDPNARHLAEREFNLSWSEHLPKGNELVQGTWFNGSEPALSVEEGIARTLGVNLGDTLTYDVAGSQFSAKVVNLRKVQWDSMQVNFFVVASPGLLEDYPASYITSFHLPDDRMLAGDALLRQFSNVLLINTGELIEQVRHIMGQIAQAMGAVFLFTLLAGLAVLNAALLATQDERIHQAAILRTLGADSHTVRRLHLIEFAALGALSGLFAAAGSSALGWVLAQQVLEIPWRFNPAIWLAGACGGVVVVTLAGWLATRRVMQVPPLRVLQSI